MLAFLALLLPLALAGNVLRGLSSNLYQPGSGTVWHSRMDSVEVSLGPDFKTGTNNIAACELRKASWWAWFNNHLASFKPPKVDFSHVHYSGPVDIRCRLPHKDDVLTSEKFMFWEFGVFSNKFKEQGKLERLSDGLKLSGVDNAQRFYVELRDPKTAHRKSYIAFNEAGIAHIPPRMYDYSVIVELKKSVFYGLSSKVVLREFGSRLPGYDKDADVPVPSEDFDVTAEKEEKEEQNSKEDDSNAVPVAVPIAVPSNEEAEPEEQPSSRLSESSDAKTSSTLVSGSSEPVREEGAPSTDAESDAGSLARMDAELSQCVKEKVEPVCQDNQCSPMKKKNLAYRAYRYCQKQISKNMLKEKKGEKEKKEPESFFVDVKSDLSSDGSRQSSTNQQVARKSGSEESAPAAPAFVSSADRNAIKSEEDLETCVQQEMELHQKQSKKRRFSVERAVKVCQKKLQLFSGNKNE